MIKNIIPSSMVKVLDSKPAASNISLNGFVYILNLNMSMMYPSTSNRSKFDKAMISIKI